MEYDRLTCDYPALENIGILSFDLKKQEFVLLKISIEVEKTQGDTKLSKRVQEVLQLVARG